MLRLHRRRNIRFPTATGQALREARPKGLPRSGLLLVCGISHKPVSDLISRSSSLMLRALLLFNVLLPFLDILRGADTAWSTFTPNSTERFRVLVGMPLCRHRLVDYCVKLDRAVSVRLREGRTCWQQYMSNLPPPISLSTPSPILLRVSLSTIQREARL